MPTSSNSSQGRRAAHFAPRAEEGAPTPVEPTGAPSAVPSEPLADNMPTPMGDTASAVPMGTGAATPLVQPSAPSTGQTDAVPMVSATPDTGSLPGVRATGAAPRMSERTARATQRAAAAHQRRHAGARGAGEKSHAVPFMALLVVVAVMVVVGMGMLVAPSLFKHDADPKESYAAGEEVIVVIPDGSSGSTIAQILVENHVIDDENEFFGEAAKQNADSLMKSGTYKFITGGTVSEVVRQLVDGPNATDFRLKLAEGLTVKQVAAEVEKQLGIKQDEFLEQAKASNYSNDFPYLSDCTDDSLEGYLYGMTYDMAGADKNADNVIRMLLEQYENEVSQLDFAGCRAKIKERFNIDISDYGIIKLASIVEKEAVTDEDRPLIASVFYNRIKNNMHLQSDATTAYVTGGEVSASDLEADKSGYNTYNNAGLTPTPICSPSKKSIEAALNPANTDYFYFFINENVHQFSKTYEEHQQAIEESKSKSN